MFSANQLSVWDQVRLYGLRRVNNTSASDDNQPDRNGGAQHMHSHDDSEAGKHFSFYRPRHLSSTPPDRVNDHGGSDEDEDETETDPQPKKRFSWLRDVALIIVAALVLSVLVRIFLLQVFWIPSPSMRDTLIENDRIAVSRISAYTHDIQRGDVIVFNDANGWLPRADDVHGVSGFLRSAAEFIGVLPAGGEQSLVKRVIGVGGDRVACCSSNGLITVNGKEITEPYISNGQPPSVIPFEATVPPDSFWVMGDNRENSGDSRYHMAPKGEPFIKRSDIVGRAMAVIFPFDRWRTLGDRDVFAGVNQQ